MCNYFWCIMYIFFVVFRICMIVVLINVIFKKYGPDRWFKLDCNHRPLAADAPIFVKFIDRIAEPALVIFVISGFYLYLSAL